MRHRKRCRAGDQCRKQRMKERAGLFHFPFCGACRSEREAVVAAAKANVASLGAGFLDDQLSGGEVPGGELVLEERAEHSIGHLAEI